MFSQWDVDGDGAISYIEFISVMKAIAERSNKPFKEKRVQAMFALADLDKNGLVDFEEFVVMQVQKYRPLREEPGHRQVGADARRPALPPPAPSIGGGGGSGDLVKMVGSTDCVGRWSKAAPGSSWGRRRTTGGGGGSGASPREAGQLTEVVDLGAGS